MTVVRADRGFSVHMHAILAAHGGVVRVAHMLRSGLAEQDIATRATCEVADLPQAEEASATDRTQVIRPVDVAVQAAWAQVVHLHGSRDWTTCLNGFADSGTPVVVTLHDCSLLTGGCVYPLDCPGITEGCFTPCPRGFADATVMQAAQRDALLRSGARLVAPSGWLRMLARKVVPQVGCTVLPNGVEVPDAQIGRDFARERLGITPEARMVLFMAHGGEQAAYKSGDRWQSIWNGLQARVPGLLGFMVGGDVQARDGNLVHLPYLDREYAQLCMAAADCFAYPTRADNHPLVVLEAMSLRCPVVAFAVGGVPEQIRHGTDGLLVPEGDWNGFADACAAVLTSRTKRTAYADAARARFLAHFTERHMVEAYMRLYERLSG